MRVPGGVGARERAGARVGGRAEQEPLVSLSISVPHSLQKNQRTTCSPPPSPRYLPPSPSGFSEHLGPTFSLEECGKKRVCCHPTAESYGVARFFRDVAKSPSVRQEQHCRHMNAESYCGCENRTGCLLLSMWQQIVLLPHLPKKRLPGAGRDLRPKKLRTLRAHSLVSEIC